MRTKRARVRARAGAGAALLLLLAVATSAADDALEDEVESAPFAVVVEHEDGWRCGGALVSLRAALSTASCARGRGSSPSTELWARAPGSPAGAGARRVARLAVPAGGQGLTESERWGEEAWMGAVLDVALLELEAPFGAEARARPILMAAGAECDARAGACLAVRTPLHAGAPLRVGNATLAPPMVCAAAASHWSAIVDTALCLTGPKFCQSDWGVGVVCAGKLCGVLSRSVRGSPETRWPRGTGGTGAGAGDAGERGCGVTHAAQHVPSWRVFVHCAQTRNHCGRDKCTSVCTERMLLEEPGGVGGDGGGGGAAGDPEPSSRAPSKAEGDTDYEDAETTKKASTYRSMITWSAMESGWHHRTGSPPQAPMPYEPGGGDGGGSGGESGLRMRASPDWRRAGANGEPSPTRTTSPTPPQATRPTGRMAQFEFEPYRADFKVGEYGDNAAIYDSGEESPTRTPAAPTPPSGPAPAGHAPAGRTPEALIDYEDAETTRKAPTYSSMITWSAMKSGWHHRTGSPPTAPMPYEPGGGGGGGGGGRAQASPDWRRAGANGEPSPTRTTSPTPPQATRPTGRMAQFEFEPYRADFKVGEYGDNAAIYDSGEESPTRTPAAPTPPSGPAPADPAPAGRAPEALLGEPAGANDAPPADDSDLRRKPSHGRKRKRSRSYALRNPLAPYFCIFLFFIDR